MLKIVLSKYGDTLENKEVKLKGMLTRGWIGHHSCGSANIGNLDLSGFSKNFNIITCSHCKTTYIIPKSIQTFGDLKKYFENLKEIGGKKC